MNSPDTILIVTFNYGDSAESHWEETIVLNIDDTGYTNEFIEACQDAYTSSTSIAEISHRFVPNSHNVPKFPCVVQGHIILNVVVDFSNLFV